MSRSNKLFEIKSCTKSMVRVVADPVPGISDEISFPLAKRVGS